jgi:hypothetical protein
VDDLLVVEIGYCADQFREDAAYERGSEDLAVACGDFEEVSARVVAEHKDRAGGFYAPGLEMYQGWVAYV